MTATADRGGRPDDTAAPRCAVAALQRADPLQGTAPPTRRWLLLEHAGPWRVDAVAGSGLDPAVLADLSAAADRTGTRVLLIRRPGRSPRPASRRWLLTGPEHGTVQGRWTRDADLADAVEALCAPTAPTSGPHEPLLLVCAHGVHDTCCALRGRPVAAELERHWPGQVWECSHVGGDRFAPNVVVLPDGYYYGGLDAGTAVETVAAHLAGAVRTPHLRGMARLPPAQQAAVVAVLERYGPLGPDAVTVVGAEHEGSYGQPGSRYRMELRVEGLSRTLQAEVLAVRRAPARLTCRAGRETPATEFRVERLG